MLFLQGAYSMMKTFIFCFFWLLGIFQAYAENTLKDKFQHAQPGDYIVTEQDNNISVLSIRSLSSSTLLLEEISIPSNGIDPLKTSWSQWAQSKAPGHTSWIWYEIDLENNQLIECFSFSRQSWLFFNESEHFFTKLIGLSFSKIPDKQKRRIGPPPQRGEVDHRRVWNPPLIVEGKKIDKPSFDVWEGKWPKDNSPLSQCKIELYFKSGNDTFPFPYWIEVNNGHYTYKIRVIDSGNHLISPIQGPMPHRPPQFLGSIQHSGDALKLTFKTPSYYKKFNLFAIDLSSGQRTPIPVPFSLRPAKEPEQFFIEISKQSLKETFQSGHRYQWMLVAEDSKEGYTETEEPFLYILPR